MRKHNYLATIQDDTWEDCKRIKELDGRSFNSLINEGLRLVRDAKMQELAQRSREAAERSQPFISSMKQQMDIGLEKMGIISNLLLSISSRSQKVHQTLEDIYHLLKFQIDTINKEITNIQDIKEGHQSPQYSSCDDYL